MSQHYMNPEDAANPHRLPNIETFQAAYGYCDECGSLGMEIAAPVKGMRRACDDWECKQEEATVLLESFGWFYWYCMPGCMPDSESFGPFESEAEALKDARGGDVQFGEDSDD